jgi:hypothetical protein
VSWLLESATTEDESDTFASFGVLRMGMQADSAADADALPARADGVRARRAVA